MERIIEFRSRYKFLSNLYSCSIPYRGLTYFNAEAAFQAQKCASEADKAKYARCRNPAEARRMGERETHLPADWAEKAPIIMEEILRVKFADRELAELLIATGDAVLENGNKEHDNRWGICSCPLCAGREAENLLGKLLMKLRAELDVGVWDDVKITDLQMDEGYVSIDWYASKIGFGKLTMEPFEGYSAMPVFTASNTLHRMSEPRARAAAEAVLPKLPEYLLRRGIFSTVDDTGENACANAQRVFDDPPDKKEGGL